MLDRLGQTKSIEFYEKAMTGQKPLNAKQSLSDTYSNRRKYVNANNVLARLKQIQQHNPMGCQFARGVCVKVHKP